MTWKLGGIRIYVEDDSGWKPTLRKDTINLLDTTSSILQTAGRESHRRDLQFVVFSGFANNILPLADDITVLFEDDDDLETTVSIMSMSPERLYDYNDRKVHRVKVELMEID